MDKISSDYYDVLNSIYGSTIASVEAEYVLRNFEYRSRQVWTTILLSNSTYSGSLVKYGQSLDPRSTISSLAALENIRRNWAARRSEILGPSYPKKDNGMILQVHSILSSTNGGSTISSYYAETLVKSAVAEKNLLMLKFLRAFDTQTPQVDADFKNKMQLIYSGTNSTVSSEDAEENLKNFLKSTSFLPCGDKSTNKDREHVINLNCDEKLTRSISPAISRNPQDNSEVIQLVLDNSSMYNDILLKGDY